jgi:hypothetical protein
MTLKIIYPPRPKGKILPSQLSVLEAKKELVAQRKFNGQRNLTHRTPEGEITIWSRYGRKHKAYRMPGFLKRELAALNYEDGKEYWLDGELLDSKVASGPKDTVVLYDVLQAGPYLFGQKLLDRLTLLNTICRSPTELADPPVALRVSDHVWLAQTWSGDFDLHFNEYLHLDLIEGLVLKEIASGLDSFGHQEYSCSWQWRCRKPGPSYPH